MRNLTFAGLALTAALSMGIAQAQAGQDMKDAGHDTAHATKTVAHKTERGTKHVAHKTAHVTKKGYHKTTRATRNTGRRVEGKPTLPNNPQ